MQKINLGELAFSAEDFFVHLEGTRPHDPNGDVVIMRVAQAFADEANRILQEKLARAKQVTGRTDMTYRPWSAYGEQKPDDTHTARLVCVEALEKKDE